MMGIFSRVREQATKRLIVLFIVGALLGGLLGGPIGALWAICLVLGLPMVLAVSAFFWATAAEWTKLGIAELYGTAAQKKMEEAASHDLRESLDAIGQEAFDELERAIARRDEQS